MREREQRWVLLKIPRCDKNGVGGFQDHVEWYPCGIRMRLFILDACFHGRIRMVLPGIWPKNEKALVKRRMVSVRYTYASFHS